MCFYRNAAEQRQLYAAEKFGSFRFVRMVFTEWMRERRRGSLSYPPRRSSCFHLIQWSCFQQPRPLPRGPFAPAYFSVPCGATFAPSSARLIFQRNCAGLHHFDPCFSKLTILKQNANNRETQRLYAILTMKQGAMVWHKGNGYYSACCFRQGGLFWRAFPLQRPD